jgi:protein involved in polysaccharide export with SLBB domain
MDRFTRISRILIWGLAITAAQSAWPAASIGAHGSAGDQKAGQGSNGKYAVTEPAPSSETYRLDTGDNLHIRFYDRYDSDDLNGIYVIGESGQVRLPRIGVFNARNRTPQELERDIRQIVERKGEKLGYFSVDVTRCRPFYVTGLVEHPGPYDFLPGLTVLHAVSLAGGLHRLPPSSIVDALREKRMLTETMSRVTELIARRARLEAEREGTQTIPVPQELVRLDPSRAREIVDGERAVLDQSRQVISREKSALESLVALKHKSAESYDREIARLEQRIEEQTKIFSQLQKLHEVKVINQQRFLEAVVSLDGLKRDKQLAVAGLSQVNTDLEKAQRDLAQLTLTNSARIAMEIAGTELELRRLKRVAAEMQKLAAGLDAAASQDNSGLVATYKIMRRNADGRLSVVQATETTPIMPGDLVQVDAHTDSFFLN